MHTQTSRINAHTCPVYSKMVKSGLLVLWLGLLIVEVKPLGSPRGCWDKNLKATSVQEDSIYVKVVSKEEVSIVACKCRNT